MASYGRYVRNDIVPSRLGETVLTDIRRSHVNAWIKELTEAGRGATTVRRALATLRMIFSTAVKDELIPTNPALNVDQPSTGDQHARYWDIPQISIFLERCGHHRLGPLFEVAAFTGLRRGELCGLHWADVDLVKREIIVRHNRVSVDGKITESTTKSKAGNRKVPLSDVVVGALITSQFRQAEERANAAEAWIGDDHVFSMEDGRALNPYVTRLFDQIRTQDEPLPPLTFHGLRHGAALLMLAGGADIAVVSKLLGHSSIAITADVYSDLIGTIGQQAVDGAAALVARTSLSPTGVEA